LKAFFLPGGGIEEGESREEALAREVREECAREVEIGRFLGSAVQYFTGKVSGANEGRRCEKCEPINCL
jgi:8-oxo-dGTP diphosphatase